MWECFFSGGVVITASFWSPIEAPASDSAVNHGWLMRLSHTHPIPTHKNKHEPGDSLQLEAGHTAAVDSCVWLLVSSAGKALIDHSLCAVFLATGTLAQRTWCCTSDVCGNVTYTYLQTWISDPVCDPVTVLWFCNVWSQSNVIMRWLSHFKDWYWLTLLLLSEKANMVCSKSIVCLVLRCLFNRWGDLRRAHTTGVLKS